MGVPKCPVKDCTIPVDIVLQASDGHRFGAHQRNLETYADGFPLSNSVITDTTNDTPVLAESTEVLRLMLCFMHHAPQPELQKLSFDVVAAFANAAEKYFIYSAIGVCKMYMANQVKDHPVAVLGYASKSHYDDIANEAAPLTLDINAQTVSRFLGPQHTLRWFKYRERHLEDFRQIYNYVPVLPGLHKGGLSDCGLWAPFELTVLRRLLKTSNMADAQGARREIIFEEMGALKECRPCTRRAENWASHTTTIALIDQYSVKKVDILWSSFEGSI